MRHLSGHQDPSANIKSNSKSDWQIIRDLLPYLLEYKFRVTLALSCLIAAKVANLGIPILMKDLINDLNIKVDSPQALLVIPVALIVAYGLLRMSASLFTELRESLFARVTQNAVRKVALQVFQHLHGLALSFHLSRQTGGVSRDIERGTRGIQSLISYSLYSILPTLIEFCLVLGYLAYAYDIWFAAITFIALVLYITFTVVVTEWRTHFRRTMNEMDSKANQKAIDSLLNFETVKYFGNEAYEAGRYDENLVRYQAAAVQSQKSLAVLNFGQQTIIAVGLVLILWRATEGVVNGSMTLGDLVLVNTLMIQLYIPLNFLGVIYREIKQALTDMDRMFSLLDTDQEIADVPNAQPLHIVQYDNGPDIRFENVSFHYDAKREILHDVSFNIPSGTITAVVGQSGAGKSTLARLLFRFYDMQSGKILIDGQNIIDVTQASLRKAIGIVPQDTVLFNDTIGYNIAYGKPGASIEEVREAARAAQIDRFIERLPQGYDTPVGERGLKLSGGEKQRVAIARTLLKKPAMLIFDEATSALDSKTERAFQDELLSLAKNRTTLVIAHRLSTIVHADQILVMDHGQIVEKGTHQALLAANGRYTEMWQMQEKAAVD
uniref:ABCB family ABC transporter ATP-binding protein/permease n=1 Tax=Polynucleobacter sp. TaxID=2029855 RepID=UPI00404856B1